MSYSNAYNLSTVLPVLQSRLGWSDTSLTPANQQSISGRRFDDGSFHPLVSVPVIKEIVTKEDDQSWDVFFENKEKAVIVKALSQVFNRQEFKEQFNVFEPYDEQLQELPNQGKAMGYRIKIANAFDVAHKVNSIELYFNAAATFNVYLFKSGSKIPVKTQSVTTTANQKTTVILTDWFLTSKDATTWYIVYFQNDLTGDTKALRQTVCWQDSCYSEVYGFEANTVATDFDRVNLGLFHESIGINFQISSFADHSTNIINQPHLFDDLIGLYMASQVLEDILYSLRSNKTERLTKDVQDKLAIHLDLKGVIPASDGPHTKGLQHKIDAEIKNIQQSFYPPDKPVVIDAVY